MKAIEMLSDGTSSRNDDGRVDGTELSDAG